MNTMTTLVIGIAAFMTAQIACPCLRGRFRNMLVAPLRSRDRGKLIDSSFVAGPNSHVQI